MKTVGATDLGGLWALEWAWHAAETNLRCVRSLGICMPNPSSSHSFRDLSVHPDRQTDGKTDMARSTRLVILIKNSTYKSSDINSVTNILNCKLD